MRRKRQVLAVAGDAEQASLRLSGLARDAELVITTPSALRDRLTEMVDRVRQTGGAVWIAEDGALAGECAARGVPVVLGRAEDVAALEGPMLLGGPGIGSLALATIRAREAEGKHGTLLHVALRVPGGRRVQPAASKRTPFGEDQRARLGAGEAARGRLARLAAPYWRALEQVVPGAARALAVDELIADPGIERLVAHGRARGVTLALELDRETKGDEDWELEAVFANATLIARFRGAGEALLVRAPLAKPEVALDGRTSDELLVRHAIAAGPSARVGTVGEARSCNEDCLLAIEGAAARAAARPTKVVLVHLPRFRNRFDELRLPSLGLARLAAYLRGYGFEVRVVDLEATHVDLELSAFTDDPRVDAFLDGTLDDELEARLGELYGPIDACVEGHCLVGFSVVDYFGHFQMNLASCLAQRVKARTGQRTVLGGERDQVDPDRALARACFDYVVDGDGEAALFELACLEAYQDREARRIDAVWSRHEGEIVRRPMVRSHLNAMPRPDFDGVPLERYRRAPSQDLLRAIDADGLFAGAPREAFAYLPYGFVKGCTADCTFCSAKEHLDVQAPEKTVDELMALAQRYGVRDFVFLNNLVNLGPRWLERFCRLLVDRRAGLQWTDSCRPTGISESLAALMRESGCLLLNYGAESGSDRVLERMQKGLGRADILATLRATHGAGILNRVNLIAGYLHETPEDVDLTISLVETLSGQIDVIGCFQGFYLFPGMGVDPAKEGIVVRDGLDRLKTGQATLAYDEVGGLRWEQKRDAIDASRNRILRRIEELGIRTIDKIDEHDLFWLSRLTRDKAAVRKYILRNPDTDAARRPALRPGGQRGRVEA